MMPILRPGISTRLFFIEAAIIGTKGGELIYVTEAITAVSASTLKILAERSCRVRETISMKKRNPIIQRAPVKSRALTFAIEATTILKI